MNEAEVSEIVLDVVSAVGKIDRRGLQSRRGADLVLDLGLDSIRMMEIWVALEERLGLQAGDIGVSLATTVDAIVEQALQETAAASG